MLGKILWMLSWAAALSAWTGLAFFLVVADIGSVNDPLAPPRVVYYCLCVLAPLLTFLPIAIGTGLKSYALETTLYWAGFTYMLAFVSPEKAPMPVFLAFAFFLFGTLYSLFVPLGYVLGFRFLTLRVHRRDTGRARREAYLAALFVTLSGAMHMAGFYNAINALLLLLILVLVECFALAHKPGDEFQHA